MPIDLRRVCVFCGSSPGARPIYAAAAETLGAVLARRGIELVYGGGSVGLMGRLADTVLALGGRVTGVIPRHLFEREVAHTGVDLRIVESMHERKTLMYDLADGFIALPGGLGTFEELFEILTWSQLGLHAKPTGLLDVAGYYDTLLTFLDAAVTERFVRPDHRALLLDADEPDALLDAMKAFEAPSLPKWLDRGER